MSEKFSWIQLRNSKNAVVSDLNPIFMRIQKELESKSEPWTFCLQCIVFLRVRWGSGKIKRIQTGRNQQLCLKWHYNNKRKQTEPQKANWTLLHRIFNSTFNILLSCVQLNHASERNNLQNVCSIPSLFFINKRKKCWYAQIYS